MDECDWIASEFESVHLGDVRLDRRLQRCIGDIAKIGQSTPHRCQSIASLKATYRLVDNPKVNYLKVLQPHNLATRERCGKCDRVYLVQDTTEIDLTKPKCQVQGVGPLSTSSRKGFFFHPLYAIGQDGVALGMVHQTVWARNPNPPKRTAEEAKKQRREMTFEQKESCRWLDTFQQGEQIARCYPQTTFVQVSDSEADMLELFEDTKTRASNCHLIVRGCQGRRINWAKDSFTGELINGATLPEAFSGAQERFQETIAIVARDTPVMPAQRKKPRHQARTARKAVLSVRAITVELMAKQRLGVGRIPSIKIHVVEAKEIDPPDGELPVHWFLWTTLSIESDEDVRAVLEGYRMRWPVEPFFMTLKSGMRAESMQYETLDRYLTAFAMLCVVAWRVEYLKTAARANPAASCEDYFAPEDCRAVIRYAASDAKAELALPTISEFLVIVAQLGGYLNRKSQGPPGAKTLWRGMQQFEMITKAYRAFALNTCGV